MVDTSGGWQGWLRVGFVLLFAGFMVIVLSFEIPDRGWTLPWGLGLLVGGAIVVVKGLNERKRIRFISRARMRIQLFLRGR
jgi:hypothetical protein